MTDDPEPDAESLGTSSPSAPGSEGPPSGGAPLTDHLTGLGSLRALEEQAPLLLIDDELTGRRSALLMIDIDEFKLVNDTLGHAAGDAVLVGMAARLRECLRDTDLICRVGGDEFAVLATGLTDDEDAGAVARKLLLAMSPELAVEDLRMHVDISVGIAVRGTDGDVLADLMRAADRAMYAAKAAGSGQYRRAGGTRLSPARSVSASEIRDAVRSGALSLHHHPQLDSATGRVVATHAVPRWQHADLGMLLARDVVSLAESSGLLGLLDESVVTMAVGDLGRIHAVSDSTRVAVDISPRALLGQALVEHLAGCLAVGRVPAELLTLQFTEPASHYSRSTAQVLAEIEQLGCRVGVHDFGAARTSLGVLARLPGIREVTVARGLVRMLPEQDVAERTVRAIVAAAHALDLEVVAAGIDSPADAERLGRLGCDRLQGDHVSPALTSAELVSLLDGQGSGDRPSQARPTTRR